MSAPKPRPRFARSLSSFLHKPPEIAVARVSTMPGTTKASLCESRPHVQGGNWFMFRRLKSCHSVADMRLLAKQRLPGPIFHYIDGAADDEVTYRRNTQAFDECDLVPNVLTGVENVDMSVTVMDVKLDMPIFCSPTALQRLFHHDGERAVARAAEKFGTMFGVSSLGTVSVEEIGRMIQCPKM